MYAFAHVPIPFIQIPFPIHYCLNYCFAWYLHPVVQRTQHCQYFIRITFSPCLWWASGWRISTHCTAWCELSFDVCTGSVARSAALMLHGSPPGSPKHRSKQITQQWQCDGTPVNLCKKLVCDHRKLIHIKKKEKNIIHKFYAMEQGARI